MATTPKKTEILGMSEVELNHLRDIVREELWKITRWMIGLFGLPILGLGVAATQAYTRHLDHVGDGHPRRVELLVQEEHEEVIMLKQELAVWREAGLPFILVEIRADLKQIKATQEELKKKLIQ